MSSPKSLPPGNLWIAKELFDLGGVQFGDFTLGRTTRHSPVYINPRVLISKPNVLRRVARIMLEDIRAKQLMARPECADFQLVAGVPVGGLHLATALSLHAQVPMMYVRPDHQKNGAPRIEGLFQQGQRVLVVDDLMTTGGSLLETTRTLEAAGLRVRNAVVLVDRDQGGIERLKLHGYGVLRLLSLKVMLNFYMAEGLITEEQYRQSLDYMETHRAEAAAEKRPGDSPA
ncbi:MAG: phosphoribosyltransferase family protein [Dehalococcoidia bacterium]|nr:phosphoribosyltransferase family protein [Dehalococcoidia bacterium]